MMGAARAVLAAAVFAATPVIGQQPPNYTILSFDDLRGWQDDDQQAALGVFRKTCKSLNGAEWASVCALASGDFNARTYFELFFRPILIEDGTPALFTGYFEPELNGSLRRTARFRYPLYRKPPEMPDNRLWFTRSEIETSGMLSGRGLEIAWIDDPVDVFYLQVQGSGRIRLRDGSTLRVGFGGSNGHSYQSIGKELVRQGVYQPSQVSAQVIRNWVRRNPVRGQALLRTNPSYVFFRNVRGVAPDQGPLGAMNASITTDRSLAVDRKFVPLGAPVWVEKGGQGSFARLMVAQDTGSAIKGAQRGDIFFGTGDEAGRAAGRVSDPGRMVVLMPIELAYAKADGLNQ